MTVDRWHRVEELYHAALLRPSDERARFLADACAGDDELRREVKSLLAQPESAEALLATGGAVAAVAPIMNTPSVSFIGQRFGAYEIQGMLGAGGMGEVYRAHDTKLRRDVAIKILPAAFTADPDRLARFEREARLLAALNHPNIATIHGLEEAGGVDGAGRGHAIVMELVEGETLAQRIATRVRHGGLPLQEALAIARQIADALDAAHGKGIVHRDLKPANIAITPDGLVKVLDFGLAKIAASDGARDLAITIDHTRKGVIVGTAAYMSPEQAHGEAVDKRTDIWAFGCVLYEMLSGRVAFARETMTGTLAAVLEREPDWSALPPVPAPVRELVQHCLQKNVQQRLRDIGDARHALVERSVDESRPSRAGRRPIWVIAAASALVIGAAAGWFWRTARSAPPRAPVSRFILDVRPADALLGANPIERTKFGRNRPSRTAVALSPDGRTIAFTGLRQGTTQLYVRALHMSEATALPGTDGADGPVFSPDGEWIAYWSGGALRKISVRGGSPVKLCASAQPAGAQWAADEAIVFAQRNTIWRVAAAGGEPIELTKRPPEGGEARHLLPQLLPGGRWLMFTVIRTMNDWETPRIVVQSLETGERKVLIEGAADARYVPTGHLLFMRLGTLMAARFDANHLTVSGGEFTVAADVMQSVNSTIPVALDIGAGQFAFSSSGDLVYVTGGVHPDYEGTLQWIRRDGSANTIPLPLPTRAYFEPRLSPDGRQLLVATLGLRDQNLWRYDFDARTLSRLTSEGRAEQGEWSTDGQRVAFALSQGGFQNLFATRSDGTGAPERLTTGSIPQFPGSWTQDGRSLIFTEGNDIKILEMDNRTAPRPVVATRFAEQQPVLSPDGHWIAYVSNETGRQEVYVQAFPGSGGKRQISTDGGAGPAWSGNGRKMTFLTSADKEGQRLMEVDVTMTATAFSAGPPHTLFVLDPAHYSSAAQAHNYDLTADATRFVFTYETYPSRGASPREMHFVQNWFEDMKSTQVTRAGRSRAAVVRRDESRRVSSGTHTAGRG